MEHIVYIMDQTISSTLVQHQLHPIQQHPTNMLNILVVLSRALSQVLVTARTIVLLHQA